MKLALLSDIHANLHALDACLAHAEAAGAQGYALLGDLVGYGAFPGEVVARCQALVAAGAAAVQGNHDHYALVDPSQAQKMAMFSAPSPGVMRGTFITMGKGAGRSSA